MASSSGNPNPSNPNQLPNPNFDLHMLFKPPPNPNPSSPIPNSSAPFSAYPPPFHHQLQQQQQQIPYFQPPHQPRPPMPYPFPQLSPNSGGAHLMALLGGGTSSGPTVPSQLETAVSMPPPSGDFLPQQILPTAPSAPPLIMGPSPSCTPLQVSPARMASGKMPKGKHLSTGSQAIYDVDAKSSEETQPTQLEVSPITKYTSDPGLVLGRQIAVNRTYICYGLRMGNIRVLNINTALRALLRGHNQRVSDMAFFADDVHLLASASIDGRVFVWKIDEGPDEQGTPQITGKIVIAIQMELSQESVHPRVCWHCHKQEILVIGIGKIVLKIDTTKVGRGETFSAEEPLKCHIDKLIDGVQFVGQHDAEVTDLSMSQWMKTRLASASKDGTVKVWEDRKAVPLVILRPHDGQPVNSVAFLTSPNRPEHILLITAGPLNRQIKIWASSAEEGWLLPCESEAWHCTQTLILMSSTESRVEDAFFNQVVVLPYASLILLANAKRNAIYAVHVDYGSNPSSTRMDYIAEFTVTMPILSLTGTTDFLPEGGQAVQVYCVQTQAIQQYALEFSQCLPPPLDSAGLNKDVSISHCLFATPTAAPDHPPGFNTTHTIETSPKPNLPISILESEKRAATYPLPSPTVEVSNVNEPNMEMKQYIPLLVTETSSSQPVSTSTDGRGLSGFESVIADITSTSEQSSSLGGYEAVAHHSVEKRAEGVDTGTLEVGSLNENSTNEQYISSSNVISMVQNSPATPTMENNATRLITPSEILSGAMTYENHSVSPAQVGEEGLRNILSADSVEGAELELKIVGENGIMPKEYGNSKETCDIVPEQKDNYLHSEVSGSNVEMTKEYSTLTTEIIADEESQTFGDVGVHESMDQPSTVNEDDKQEIPKDVSESIRETSVAQSATIRAKQKAKQSQQSGSSFAPVSLFDSTESLNEQGCGSCALFNASTFSQIMAIQESLNQLMSMQKEIQKEMPVTVAAPVSKESKRLETSLVRAIDKSIKSNVDALWLRFQEENTKREKAEKDRVQQITNNLTSYVAKDLPALFEKALKKEFSSVGAAVTRSITPVIEKSISSVVADSIQKVVGDKALNQLEKAVNSKLEVTVPRQIQTQFQTSGRQALQEALRSTLEASVVPAFEQSCKVMFEQVDVTFRKGMTEHTAAALNQFESTHTPLALTLRDAINSASSFTQNLTSELAEGQRKLLALAASGNQNSLNSISMQQTNDPLIGLPMAEAPVDPTKELTRLISDHKFDEAFTLALQRSDVSIVSWLCSQVDLQGICSIVPLPLSQGVLLALLQQLSCDISRETPRKLGWMTDVAGVINPTDPTIALHVRPIFEQIYQILNHHRSMPTTIPSEASSIRLILHVINSVLMSCK